MRVVVIATKENKAAVAGKGGILAYIENHDYEKGQILEIDDSLMFSAEKDEENIVHANEALVTTDILNVTDINVRKKTRHKKGGMMHLGSSVAAACVLLALTGVVTSMAAPVSSVILSDKGSVKMEVNIFDRVVGVSSNINTDESTVSVTSDKLLGRPVQEAVKNVITVLNDNDSNEKAFITGTVSENSRSDHMIKQLEEAADSWNEENSSNIVFEAGLEGQIKNTDRDNNSEDEKELNEADPKNDAENNMSDKENNPSDSGSGSGGRGDEGIAPDTNNENIPPKDINEEIPGGKPEGAEEAPSDLKPDGNNQDQNMPNPNDGNDAPPNDTGQGDGKLPGQNADPSMGPDSTTQGQSNGTQQGGNPGQDSGPQQGGDPGQNSNPQQGSEQAPGSDQGQNNQPQGNEPQQNSTPPNQNEVAPDNGNNSAQPPSDNAGAPSNNEGPQGGNPPAQDHSEPTPQGGGGPDGGNGGGPGGEGPGGGPGGGGPG